MSIESKLELQEVVGKFFGNNLQSVENPTNSWYKFKPFVNPKAANSKSMLLKLFEIPSSKQTSQEIIAKTKIKFKGLIHEVQFYQLQRNFEKHTYLLRAQQNMMPVEKYIELKKQAHEIIQQKFILKFLQFAGQLQNHPYSHEISFQLDQIGIDGHEKFKLANYSLYFINKNLKVNKSANNLSLDIRKMLCRLLCPANQVINLIELYSYVELHYSEQILKLVEKCIKETQFRASEVVSTHNSEQSSSILQTTLTDSFHSGNMGEDISNIVTSTATLQQSLLFQPLLQKQSTKKPSLKLTMLSVAFILIVLIIGGITFAYLRPRPLVCQQWQYLSSDQSSCLACDSSCNSCQNEGGSSCLSCRDGQYLIKRERVQRVGRCGASCAGMRIGANVCIDAGNRLLL